MFIIIINIFMQVFYISCLPYCDKQGGRPSPFDRNMGTKMAAKCLEKMIEQLQACKQEDGMYAAEIKINKSLIP